MKKENLFTQDSIRTFTGQYVNVFEPNPDTILIEDIAHALSQQPRFGGHLPLSYSVLQHCILCCEMSNIEDKYEALMHDAGEAYLLDFPKPIKMRIPQYNEIEDNLMKVISKKFGFKYPKSENVKTIDEAALIGEWEYLMLGNKNYTFSIPENHKDYFLDLFYTLSKHNSL